MLPYGDKSSSWPGPTQLLPTEILPDVHTVSSGAIFLPIAR